MYSQTENAIRKKTKHIRSTMEKQNRLNKYRALVARYTNQVEESGLTVYDAVGIIKRCAH